MTRHVHTLLIDRVQDGDSVALQNLRSDDFEVTSTTVDALPALRDVLASGSWDLMICNDDLEGFDTLDALGAIAESGLDLPVLVLLDSIHDESVVSLIHAGADDFVLKGNMSRLGPAVRRVLEEADRRRTSRREEASVRAMLEGSPLGLMVVQDGRVTASNAAAANIFGTAAGDLIGLTEAGLLDSFVSDDSKRVALHLQPDSHSNGHPSCIEARVKHREKGTQWVEMTVQEIDVAGVPAVQAAFIDVTDRRQREREFEAIGTLSTVLRSVKERTDAVPLLLDQTLDLLSAEGTALAMRDAISDDVVFEHARGVWNGVVSGRLGDSTSLTREVFSSGAVFVGSTDDEGCRLNWPEVADTTRYLAGAPMIAEAVVIGVLWVGRSVPFDDDDVRVLNSIADVAASVLRRITLEEETKLRLARLHALRSIDLAISEFHDVQSVYDVVIDQVLDQLHVDAACILRWHTISDRLITGKVRAGGTVPAILEPRMIEIDGLADRVARRQEAIETTGLGSRAELGKRDQALVHAGFETYVAVPLVAKGEIRGVLELLHGKPLVLNREQHDFLETVAWQVAIAIDNATATEELRLANVEFREAYDSILEGWAQALDLREGEGEGHTERVTELTVALAQALGIEDEDVVQVFRGALLHDIGRMAIPESILLKPGPLDEEEWEIVRQHPVRAAELLENIPHLQPAIDIPYGHHERWDGSGYPLGLKGEAIPIAARLFAVVDVWEALRTSRPYRDALSDDDAITYLTRNAGTLFDPEIINVFLDMITKARP
jgi:PAS domain S-box-containing protein/putative nucleotidyltransferase with HDIG domain